MKTIRQIYTYLTTLVSLEVVAWGMIRLARTLANPKLALDTRQLAGALALIVVGVPIFWFHWQMAQRQTKKEDDERFSLVRALFLYSALLATFLPLLHNALSLINRILLRAFHQPVSQAVFGGQQIWSDNAIAVFMNALIGSYIFMTARKDWSKHPPNDHLANIRRAYRYVYLLYSLALMVGGLHEILFYLLSFPDTVGGTPLQWLANGLALLGIGTPLWILCQNIIQRSLQQGSKRTALLRQIVLFFLSLIGAAGTLVSLGFVLHLILNIVLGESQTWGAFMAELGQPLGFAVPLGGIWAYYGRAFRHTLTMKEIPKRGDIFQKLYRYLLAGSGVTAVIIGLRMLLNVLIDMGMRSAVLWGPTLRNRLSASLASLAVGLPLWLLLWRRINMEIRQKGAGGDRAQRSLIRKAYLYIMLFAGIIGVMISGGRTAFVLFKALLGLSVPDLVPEVLSHISLFLIFSGLLAYHLVMHRRDIHQAQRFLSDLHAQFPVLILTQEEGAFASQVSSAVQRETPSLPVSVHTVQKDLPAEAKAEAKAVILPGRLAVEPSPELRAWLKDYPGHRLVVPTDATHWHWVSGGGRPLSSLAKHTARLVRDMAEGEENPTVPDRSPLQTVLSILGILFSLQILFSILALLASALFG